MWRKSARRGKPAVKAYYKIAIVPLILSIVVYLTDNHNETVIYSSAPSPLLRLSLTLVAVWPVRKPLELPVHLACALRVRTIAIFLKDNFDRWGPPQALHASCRIRSTRVR